MAREVRRPVTGAPQRPVGREVERYHYVDQHNIPLFDVVRFEPKRFLQQRAGGAWSLGNTPRPLYRLPQVVEAVAMGRRVYIVEGEKDVHALEALGVVATCNPGGAGKWRPEHTATLLGAFVTIVVDDDEPGWRHADVVQAALEDVVEEFVIAQPRTGKDAADHIAAGHELNFRTEDELDRRFPPSATERTVEVAPSIRITNLADVAPQEIEWLWDGYIPLGAPVLLDADPGTGKSTLTCDLAARVSRGSSMPTGVSPIHPGGVVMLNVEDDIARTTVPRLIAAGADLTRIVTVAIIDEHGERPPLLNREELAKVEEAIKQVGAVLVVIDPFMAYLPSDVNSHKDQDVRRSMSAAADLAERTGATILLVRHMNKSGGSDPMYRGGGSIGIIGAARAGYLLGRDPADPPDTNRRVLAHTKLNLGPPPSAVAFRLETPTGGHYPVIEWEGPVDLDASRLLDQAKPAARPEFDEAVGFLRTELASGSRPSREVQRLAGEEGIAPRTLKRAKRELQVESVRVGFGKGSQVFWRLPGHIGPDDAIPPALAPYEETLSQSHTGPSGIPIGDADHYGSASPAPPCPHGPHRPSDWRKDHTSPVRCGICAPPADTSLIGNARPQPTLVGMFDPEPQGREVGR